MTLRADLNAPGIASSTHAGLWLDRYLPDFAKSGDHATGSERNHIQRLLTHVHTPDVYRSHFDRWRTHLTAQCAQGSARMAEATVNGRMIVGLGTESILEVGISLHRTYGVPVIPGSALKGLTARYTRRLDHHAWRPMRPSSNSPDTAVTGGDPHEGESYRALFGDHTEAGCVVFHDALWIPHKADRLPLDLDVMTVHHAAYYQLTDDTPPADTDNPNPVPFVTARGSYLIALEGPPAWTDAAMAILQVALSSDGIGAKTAAGYGRLALEYTSMTLATAAAVQKAADEAAAETTIAAQAAESRQRRIVQLLRDLEVNNAADKLPELLALAGDAEQYAIALKCRDKIGAKRVQAAIKDGKTWVTSLGEILSLSAKSTSA